MINTIPATLRPFTQRFYQNFHDSVADLPLVEKEGPLSPTKRPAMEMLLFNLSPTGLGYGMYCIVRFESFGHLCVNTDVY